MVDEDVNIEAAEALLKKLKYNLDIGEVPGCAGPMISAFGYEQFLEERHATLDNWKKELEELKKSRKK